MAQFLDSAFWGTPTTEPADPHWLWHGYLAPGKITLLTALWKSGKTTLLAHLLAQRKAGGTFLDQPVAPGVSTVVSEEGADLWHMRRRSLDLSRVCIFSRPFAGRPSLPQMDEFVGRLLEMKKEHAIDLVVFDTLFMFLPSVNENSADLVLAGMSPFVRLADAGMSVLLMHHPRKGEPGLGQASRGSGALLGAVDLFLEMRLPAGDPFTRRRRLLAWSRFEETPKQMLIELTPEGSYIRHGEEAASVLDLWDAVRLVLMAAEEPLTRQEIRRDWPDESPPPGDTALWKCLNRAVEMGLVRCEGEGTRGKAFRYWLVEREEL